MGENIKLNKEVFNKRIYPKTIDISFKELGVKSIQEQLNAQPTVEEFFNLYNELFYQINELGPTNSHEYLVKTSGEYISFEERDELIEALQKEIAELRKELLKAQQDLADALTPDEVVVEPIPEVEVPMENPVVDIVNTPAPIQNTPSPTTTDPYPNQNDVAVEWYNAKLQGLGSGNGYKARPVTYQMMVNNLDHLKQNGLLLNDKNNDYKNTKNTLEKVKSSNTFSSAGSYVGENYTYALWDKLRASIKDNKKNNDAKENLYDVLSKTVDKMGGHYNRERNFNQSGGFL